MIAVLTAMMMKIQSNWWFSWSWK